MNVGGRVVKMDQLRRVFESLGLSNVETFIASGNVIFESGSKNPAALETRIERALKSSFGFDIDVFVRTAEEVVAIAAHQAFPRKQRETARAFIIGFLASPLDAAGEKALMSQRSDVDDFRVHGREVYWLCGVNQGQSDFSNAVFERVVKKRTTFRGVNTIAKIAEKYCRGKVK